MSHACTRLKNWVPHFVLLIVPAGNSAAIGEAIWQESPQEISETGHADPRLENFDHLMREFLVDNQLPGGALAVARQGRLVYARGFGWSDREAREPVRPDSLFRIASLSKPITAMAVLRLVDQGELALNDRAFELLPHRTGGSASGQADPRLQQITVRHVLQHRGGWDRDRSVDPMFCSWRIAAGLGLRPPADPDAIISFMMGWRLDFPPGTRYSYSNFGYCVLGRVIERVTGQAYEGHVQADLFRPLGIERMRIGRSLRRHRAEGEVCYYTRRRENGMAVVGPEPGRQVPRAYGTWSMQAMDAHGGWIGSVVDIARFGSQVQTNERSCLLSSEIFREMLARPVTPEREVADASCGEGADRLERSGGSGQEAVGDEKTEGDEKTDPVFYGLGWQVRELSEQRVNLWHTGGLPGTSALLVLRHDGLCWAVLFNQGWTPDGKRPVDKLDASLHAAADAVKEWPEHDLFEEDPRGTARTK